MTSANQGQGKLLKLQSALIYTILSMSSFTQSPLAFQQVQAGVLWAMHSGLVLLRDSEHGESPACC